MLFAPSEKGKKGRKRVKKTDFGRFPGRAARHLFVTPPFAAAQVGGGGAASSQIGGLSPCFVRLVWRLSRSGLRLAAS